MKRILFGLLVILSAVVFAPFSAAQELASVTGVVADNTGAVISGADVKLVDTKTNASYKTKTNSIGAYTFVKVLPGPGYKLTVTRDGFESFAVSNLYVGVGSANTRNIEMQVGAVTQTVEVSAEGQPVTLNTTDTTVGTSFDMRMVHELPIEGRDSPTALLILQPGVTNGPAGDGNSSRDGAITGARTDQTNVTLDGLDVNDFATGQSFSTVGNAPVDSIQEFRGETANPLAASGRGSGAQVQLVTQSGSNDWHGGVWEYHRNTITEANTVFNSQIGLPVPKLIRNQFGAKIGGPVVKDKLFFFFDYQGRRDAREDSVLRTVPTDAFLTGNVSYINNGPGCDESSRLNTTPACITTVPNAGSGTTLTSIDPKHVGNSTSLLSFINGRYPHANDPTQGDGVNTEGFRFNAPAYRSANDYVARVDYNLTDKMKLFGRISILKDSSGDDANFAAPFQFPGDPITHSIVDHSYAYVLGHTWTISPTKVNNFFYGETRSQLNFPTQFNPNGTTYWQNFGPLTAPFSDQQSQNRIIPIPVFRDDFNYLHGKHNFQVGGTFKPIRTRSIQVNDFNFVSMGTGGNLASLSQPGTDPLRPTDIFRDANDVSPGEWDSAFAFMLGRFGAIASNFNNDHTLNPLPQGTGHRRDYRYYETEVYFQDTWRMRSDLTMTYGLRYQYYSVPYESAGLEAVPNMGLADFFNPRAAAAAQGTTDLPLVSYNFGGKANSGAPGLYNPDWKDFAPRLAFAYNPASTKGFLGHVFGDRKTVIRAGGGLIFDHPVSNALNFIQDQLSYIFQNASNTRFGATGHPTTDPTTSLLNDPRFTDINTIPAITPALPVTVPFQPFVENGVPTGTADNQINYAIDPTLKTPYSIALSFGFQRELPGNFLLETQYIGRFGRRLIAQADAGQATNFKDPTSGHFLSNDFAALTSQVRAGTSAFAVTPQPFFENQMGAALGDTCEDVFGASCTTVVAFFLPGLVARGDITDVLQNLDGGGLLPPGVGLHPQFATSAYITNKAFSSYNGLLTTLHKRLSHNLQFDLNYTFSHSIDNISAPTSNIFGTSNLAGGLICDITNLRACRGNSDFDVTHIISGNYIYELPLGKGKQFGSSMPTWLDEAVGGWQVSGTVAWNTGFAFTSVSNAFPLSFENNAPGIFVGNPSDISTKVHSTDKGFQLFKDQDTAMGAFRGPLGLESGQRNNLRGPSYTNFDMGVAKHFPIKEKYVIEFRADAFNVFNHVNFGLPGGGTADITNPNQFGIITTQAAPRQMQFALRLDF